MREKKYSAIILKKQSYGEGDEIVTFFSRELGKLRGLAKSVKFSKSKLQYSLQSLFLVELTLAGRGIPKIIGVEVRNSFAQIRDNLTAAKVSLYASELTLKFTPDEQSNEALFELLATFLGFLNDNASDEQLLQLGLAKFKIDFLHAVGLSIGFLENAHTGSNSTHEFLGFSNNLGGFVKNKNTGDVQQIDFVTYEVFEYVRRVNFDQLAGFHDLNELQHVLSSFIQYQLERDIKSEQLLNL